MALALFAQMQIIHPCCRNGENQFVEISRFHDKKRGTLHAHPGILAMTRHYMKTGVVSLLMFVLLYYGVAWAVLGCFHEEDQAHHTVIMPVTEAQASNTYLPFSHHAQVNLDCLGSNYHTESLAGPSSSSQLLIRIARAVSHGMDNLPLYALDTTRAHRLWLKAVLDRFPSTNFLIDLPRYLSFSVLRI